MEQLFPNGIASYLIGGLIAGAGIGLIYVFTGRIAGLSAGQPRDPRLAAERQILQPAPFRQVSAQGRQGPLQLDGGRPRHLRPRHRKQLSPPG